MNMVVRTSDGAVSLLVDEIGDVLDMDAATYERTPENLDPAARDLIRGVYKLKGRLLLVLDAERTVDLAIERKSVDRPGDRGARVSQCIGDRKTSGTEFNKQERK